MTFNRRDFLRNVGIASAATATACAYDPKTPTENILPYVHQGDDVLPGQAMFYSTLCVGCANACGVVARAKDGRVTMVEGNPDHPHGPGLCTRGHFELLATYSPDRAASPVDAGAATSWDAAMEKLSAAVKAAQASGKQVAWLGQYRTGSVAKLLSEVPGLRRVHWEALGVESMIAATRKVYGTGFFPGYELADAQVIVSFGHDFLGTGFDSMRSQKGWAKAKDPAHGNFVTRFVAIEPRVSVTSSQADNHFRPVPGTETLVALALGKLVAAAKGYTGSATALFANVDVEEARSKSGLGARLEVIAEWIAKAERSVILPGGHANAGADATELAVATLALNEVAGNVGSTVLLDKVSVPGRVHAYKDVQALLADATAGKIGVLFMDGVDPVFNLPASDKAAEALGAVDLLVQLGNEANDSTAAKTLLLPTGSALETWGDAQVTRGVYVLQQPAMNAPANNAGKSVGDLMLALAKSVGWQPPVPEEATAPAPEVVEETDVTVAPEAAPVEAAPVEGAAPAEPAVVPVALPMAATEAAPAPAETAAGEASAEAPKAEEKPKGPVPMGFAFADFAAYVKERWRREVFPRSGQASFDVFWTSAQQRGGFFGAKVPSVTRAASFVAASPKAVEARGTGAMHLVVFPSPILGDGRHANRPWAQELPDPISTYAWTSWAELNPADVAKLGLSKVDRVKITSGDASITVGVFQSPGVAEGTVAVVMGNGHVQAGRYGTGRGANPIALVTSGMDEVSGAFAFAGQKVDVVRADAESDVYAMVGPGRKLGEMNQDGRPLANVVSAEDAVKRQEPEAGTPVELLHGHVGSLVSVHHIPVDPRLEKQGLVDMFPTPQHPNYRFAMAFDTNTCNGCMACVMACNLENNIAFIGPDQIRRGRTMSWIRMDRFWEGDGEQQDVRYLPALCQHCAHAPCEGVCPVLATYHNLDGLNAMIYNRCVGTRYCANNCPYTARRFNYHTWEWPESMHLMLNPDVSVREMGVMEKCTFCVQRTRTAKDMWRDVSFANREDGKPLASVEKVPSAALEKLTACAAACPTGAITFGDANDAEGAVAKKITNPRAYTLLGELNTKPGVRYLARVQHDPKSSGAHHGASHGESHEAPAAAGHEEG